MKQNISKKQWNELNEKQRVKWFSFIKDEFATYPETIYECNDCGVSCLPSIGQMIEFLEDYWKRGIDIKWWRGDKHYTVEKALINNEKLDKRWGSINICDCLWEAVKEVLK